MILVRYQIGIDQVAHVISFLEIFDHLSERVPRLHRADPGCQRQKVAGKDRRQRGSVAVILESQTSETAFRVEKVRPKRK